MIESIARIAQVLDDYTVVLNKGEVDGVEINDKFLIYGIGENIYDPETNEDLGPIELVRGRVKVTHVQEKICTARTSQSVRKQDSKKITSRTKNAFALMTTPVVERIEEDIALVDKPLCEPEVGDYARPY